MLNLINKLMKDESGQDIAEYAIALGLVALAAVGVGTSLNGTLTSVWGKAQAAINAVLP